MDFLDRFKLSKNGQHVVAAGKKESVFFQVDFDPEGRAFVQTVDPSGKPIRTDYRLYQGDTFILLRSIAAIEEKNRSRISWETVPGKVYFDEHPHLVYQLIRCNQVVDSALTPLKALPGKFRVTLTADKQGDRYLPSFRLRPVDREAQDALVSGPFRMIKQDVQTGETLAEMVWKTTLKPRKDEDFLVPMDGPQRLIVSYRDDTFGETLEEELHCNMPLNRCGVRQCAYRADTGRHLNHVHRTRNGETEATEYHVAYCDAHHRKHPKTGQNHQDLHQEGHYFLVNMPHNLLLPLCLVKCYALTNKTNGLFPRQTL